jgi:hypothetical protein
MARHARFVYNIMSGGVKTKFYSINTILFVLVERERESERERERERKK